MLDPRVRQLADLVIHHSCQLQPGEKVLIEAVDVPPQLVTSLMQAATGAGARPLILLKSQQITRRLLLDAQPEQLDIMAEAERHLMSSVEAYIGVRGGNNVSELSDVPPEQLRLYESRVWRPVHLNIRVPHTRWTLLRWPNPAMAQLAQQSTESFEDFYFRVCTVDYRRMAEAMKPLVELMARTDEVRLVAPGTDLRFSIRGIPTIPCAGERNIPDGELFTAPVRDSVQGTIRYNTPSLYRGVTHERVTFTFRDGCIVDATSTHPEDLEAILETDEGARYVGEFAIGVNPHITQPMKDTLFDEKIAGSIHFTPGKCYDEAYNGNNSQVHWDLVLLMTPEYGGGEIHFDGRVVRKDGRFVVPELEPLNPENLS